MTIFNIFIIIILAIAFLYLLNARITRKEREEDEIKFFTAAEDQASEMFKEFPKVYSSHPEVEKYQKQLDKYGFAFLASALDHSKKKNQLWIKRQEEFYLNPVYGWKFKEIQNDWVDLVDNKDLDKDENIENSSSIVLLFTGELTILNLILEDRGFGNKNDYSIMKEIIDDIVSDDYFETLRQRLGLNKNKL